MKKICLFDVNETLLDLRTLDTAFEQLFGSTSVRKEWFGQLIQSALVSVATNSYHPFSAIASAAFDMVAERRHVSVAQSDKQMLLGLIAQLPPHPEVPEQLARLKQEGYVVASLTNSTLEVVQKQLQNAGIVQYFDKVLSVDAIRRLKPAKEAYEMAAQSFGVTPADTRLIAAHAWDITGALHAGCSAAFIARPGMVLDPLSPEPTISGNDLQEVVDRIIEEDTIALDKSIIKATIS